MFILCHRSEDSLQWSTCNIPDGSPSEVWQSAVGWGDYQIRIRDCSFTIQCHYQLPTTTRVFGAFASVQLFIHVFCRSPANRVNIYSRMGLQFWGCRAVIRTSDCLTAVRRADHLATSHPSRVSIVKSTLAVFQRKCKSVEIYYASLKNWKIKGRVYRVK